MERRISHITYQDFSALVPARIKSVLLPVGTMEAHGCTNLGTDITIPEYLCSQSQSRADVDLQRWRRRTRFRCRSGKKICRFGRRISCKLHR
ncbi:creatininase family protein [bacterium]|nr:creatininase family protein [bacterium]